MIDNIKIVIADDNKNFCESLRQYLETHEDFQIVGITNNGMEALELVETHEPDVLILELIMPSDGLGVFGPAQLYAQNVRK